jgi:hypothetical protein
VRTREHCDAICSRDASDIGVFKLIEFEFAKKGAGYWGNAYTGE